MSGKEDCNVCMFSITWYEQDAWEEEDKPETLRAGFVGTPTGMTIYCKLQKKFFPPSHRCSKWRDIKLRK